MSLLRFTFENAKLKGIWHFSLPSGHTCPGAKSCKTFADKITGKIMDAQKAVDGVIFRCYAAMDEARRPNVRKTRWENFDLLKACKTTKAMAALIIRSIKASGLRRGGTLRVHIGGDYFSQVYFNAWMKAASFFYRSLLWSFAGVVCCRLWSSFPTFFVFIPNQ